MNLELQFINIATLLLLVITYAVSGCNIKKNILIFIFLMLFIFISTYYPGLRSFNYGDTKNYLNYFNGFSDEGIFEIGYNFLTKILKYFNLDFRYYISIIGFISSSILTLSIYKVNQSLSKYNNILIIAVIANLCFFQYYFMLYEAIRDGISTSLLFLSIYFLVKGDRKWFLFFLIISVSFHKAALIFFSLIFLMDIKINNKWYLILFIIIISMTSLIKDLLLSLDFLGSYINNLLLYYSQDLVNSKTVFIRYCIILLFGYFLWDRVDDESKKFLRIVFLLVLIGSLFFSLPDMYRRVLIKIEYISYPILILIYLNRYKWIRVSDNIKLNNRFVLIFLLLLYYILFISNYHSIYNLLDIKPMSYFLK